MLTIAVAPPKEGPMRMLTSSRNLSVLVMAAWVLAVLGGCRRTAAVAPEPDLARIVSVTNQPGDGGFRATFAWHAGGERQTLEVRIDPDLAASYRSSTTTVAVVDAGAQVEQRDGLSVQGNLVGIDDGALRIGGSAFGSVAGAREVHISQRGVFVDGERRGDLP